MMEITQGEKAKWGYGYCWRNYDRDTITTFLVPFNLLLRWGREIYFYLGGFRKSSLDNIYNDGYNSATKFYQEREEIIKKKELEKGIQVGWDLFNEMFPYRNLPKEEYYKKAQELKDNLLKLKD